MGLRLNYNVCGAFALLTIAALVQDGAAIKCWVCESNASRGCGDPMNITDHHRDAHIKDCEAPASQGIYGFNERHVCKKVVKRDKGQLVIERTCAVPSFEERDMTNGPCGPHTAQQNQYATIESCHICNTDYCNGASSISGMQLLQACAIAVIAITTSLRSFV